MPRFDLIGLDADDTLWHTEKFYHAGYARFDALLAQYGVEPGYHARQQEIEIANLQYYGYGIAGFVLSLIEAAVELTGGRLTAADTSALLELAKQMYTAEIELFDEVRPALEALAGRYPLGLITKGDLRHQGWKLEQSGLRELFAWVEIVPDKTPAIFAEILARRGVAPERFLMVGDSLRSDVLPVLELGGWAAHVPHPLAWDHEKSDLPRLVRLERLSDLPGWLAGEEE
jgi:putative hydrolase of the HAD superfamily